MNQTSTSRSRCESCAHFHNLVNGQGRCHRFPPSFTASSSDINIHHWQLPLVHIDSWCGEHAPAGSEVKVSLKNQ